jgi:hypothetical protein
MFVQIGRIMPQTPGDLSHRRGAVFRVLQYRFQSTLKALGSNGQESPFVFIRGWVLLIMCILLIRSDFPGVSC